MIRKKENNESKEKPKGEVVHATIPKEQYEAIKKLEGVLGVGVNGVVANIIHSWLYQQEWFNEIIKNKMKEKK